MPDVFRQAGYILVSINYRLSPAVDFPTQAEDVAAAVAWVRANIADYGGDPTRLYLMGHSAGAHLVALIGTDARYLAAHNRLPTDLSGVIGLDTQAYDLTALAEARSGRLPDVFAEVFGQERDFWAFASSITYVTEGAVLPPFLLPYNSRGLRSRADINEALAAALRGVDAVAYTLPVERTHPQFVREFGAADDPVASAVLAFAADPATFDPALVSPGSP
jgi:acetyl esterase/lipase